MKKSTLYRDILRQAIEKNKRMKKNMGNNLIQNKSPLPLYRAVL